MRIVRTNKDLFKFKLVNSTLCDFCYQHNETTYHLFWECSHVQELWRNIANIFRQNNIDIELNYSIVSLGILNQSYFYTPLNYITLIAKYFIFRCKCLNEIPQYNHFKYYLHEQCRIEKHIAQRKGKLSVHNAKWDGFIIETWILIHMGLLLGSSSCLPSFTLFCFSHTLPFFYKYTLSYNITQYIYMPYSIMFTSTTCIWPPSHEKGHSDNLKILIKCLFKFVPAINMLHLRASLLFIRVDNTYFLLCSVWKSVT